MTVFRQIWKTIRGRLLLVSGIIGVLMFLCAIFLLGTHHMESVSDQAREKLGIYLYLDDADEVETLVTAEALDMVDEFSSIGVQSQFYTKEDAFGILQKKLPEITADLQKYGIENPLPPTLYIVFENENQWTQVKDIVLKYETIIQNTQDLDSTGFSFSEQERRVVDVLNIISIARISMLFLLFVLGGIVIAMVLFLVESIYQRMYSDVEVKVLSGLPYRRISLPFLMVGASVFLVGYIVHLALLLTCFEYIAPHITRVFQTDAYELFFPPIMSSFELFVLIGGTLLCLFAGWILLYMRIKKFKA